MFNLIYNEKRKMDFKQHICLSSLLFSSAVFAAGSSSSSRDVVAGYVYGQPIPVSCLNRTIDSGEHIRDGLGRLQYIPFLTCNETSLPLALNYGVTETISCTIDSLPDELYHLLEYYVHSDAPLTCRVPTIPLGGEATSGSDSAEYNVVDVDGGSGSSSDGEDNGPPYTPLTIALQGTLQRSHLHIWTDMNVLMHRLSSAESPRKEEISLKKQQKRRRSTKSPGYVVAGTAYSLPELHSQQDTEGTKHSKEKEDAAIIENARNPWTAGHGTKVVRGEPLTLKFRVSWVSGADSLGWLDHDLALLHQGGGSWTVLGVLTKVVFFVMAAGIGALLASYYQRVVRRGGGWKGDGILGRPMSTMMLKADRRSSASGVTYGNGGRTNGYGGYSSNTNGSQSPGISTATSNGGGGYGYGGYGKKD